MAYYDRDFDAALRLADAAVAAAGDEERRTSGLTLAGRARHSRGDLAGAAADLEAAVTSSVPGVRGTGEVWLGALRVHQGRPAEALELSARGAVDAAAMRHPFVIPHAMFSRVYALGMSGRVAEALVALEAWDAAVDDLGPAGARFRPMVDNFWAWILGAIGRVDDAEARSRAALAKAGQFSEPRHHALLDLALAAVEREDGAEATEWLGQLEVPADEAGAMAWHQRQRKRLLEGRIGLLEGDAPRALVAADWVRADARRRGSLRAAVQADVLAHLAHAPGGVTDDVALAATFEGLDRLARLEGWRLGARVVVATRRDDLWPAVDRLVGCLLDCCGADARRTGEWIERELTRLGR